MATMSNVADMAWQEMTMSTWHGFPLHGYEHDFMDKKGCLRPKAPSKLSDNKLLACFDPKPTNFIVRSFYVESKY